MKKFLFTIIVLGTFTGYVLYVQHSGSSLPVIAPPPGLLSVQSATSSSSSQGASPPPSNTNQNTLGLEPIPSTSNTPVPTQVPVQTSPPATQTPTPTPTPPKPTPTPASPPPAPTPTPTPTPTPQGKYKNGSYTGSVADAYYGNVQVQVTVSGGAITNVVFLQYPNDRSTSRYINSQAMPYLTQEAIQAQSANVDTVSGASDTSQAFQQSLAYALTQAQN